MSSCVVSIFVYLPISQNGKVCSQGAFKMHLNPQNIKLKSVSNSNTLVVTVLTPQQVPCNLVQGGISLIPVYLGKQGRTVQQFSTGSRLRHHLRNLKSNIPDQRVPLFLKHNTCFYLVFVLFSLCFFHNTNISLVHHMFIEQDCYEFEIPFLHA